MDSYTWLKIAKSPGTCSAKEIKEAKNWLEDFREQLYIYREVFGEPLGYSVQSQIDNLCWYE
jgi:hypothetical protein